MLSRTKQGVFVLETPEMNAFTYKNDDFVLEAAPPPDPNECRTDFWRKKSRWEVRSEAAAACL